MGKNEETMGKQVEVQKGRRMDVRVKDGKKERWKMTDME